MIIFFQSPSYLGDEIDLVHSVSYWTLNAKTKTLVPSPIEFVYFDEVLTIHFYTCSRSVEGVRCKGFDEYDDELKDPVSWLNNLKEIEQK